MEADIYPTTQNEPLYMARKSKMVPVKAGHAAKRKRRTPEEMINDLQSEIARIKTRAERQKAIERL